jgi:hypothetical protein
VSTLDDAQLAVLVGYWRAAGKGYAEAVTELADGTRQ